MVGYRISIQDNDSYALRERPAIREDTYWYEVHQTLVPNMSGAQRPGVRRCEKCGELLAKWEELLTGLVLKKRHYDISCTYDGVVVVSPRFKEAYESNGLIGLRFISLPDDKGFFQVQGTATVLFDAEKRRTRFEKQCPACGRFEFVVGATPVFLKEGSTIPDRGFVRTDLEFGSGDGKHPLLLCGFLAGKLLNAAKLKGLDLVEF